MPLSIDPDHNNDWRPLPAWHDPRNPDTTLTYAQIKRWSLLLTAVQIDFRQEKSWFGNRLLVHPDDYEKALEQIEAYETENRNWPPEPAERLPNRGSPLITLSVIFLIASFHNLTQSSYPVPYFDVPDWYHAGNLYAGKFRSGELWRGVTALTLHADLMHLTGNGVVTFLFVEQLRKRYGSGLTWLLFLLSGMTGNAMNALLQPYHHQAVGASTAVFGILGIIAADSLIRYRLQLMRRWLMPLAAACALLGFLGTSGENTDLGAHLWGFFCGLGIGMLVAVAWRHLLPPADLINRYLGALGIALVCICWLTAVTT